MRSVQLVFFVSKFTRDLSRLCQKELFCLVENHVLYIMITMLRAVASLDFEIIEFKHRFCGSTHTQTHKQTTIPSAHAGKGNNRLVSICYLTMPPHPFGPLYEPNTTAANNQLMLQYYFCDITAQYCQCISRLLNPCLHCPCAAIHTL